MTRSVSTPVAVQVRLVAYLLGGAAVVLELAALFMFSHFDGARREIAGHEPPAVCYPAPRGPVIALPSLELML